MTRKLYRAPVGTTLCNILKRNIAKLKKPIRFLHRKLKSLSRLLDNLVMLQREAVWNSSIFFRRRCPSFCGSNRFRFDEILFVFRRDSIILLGTRPYPVKASENIFDKFILAATIRAFASYLNTTSQTLGRSYAR